MDINRMSAFRAKSRPCQGTPGTTLETHDFKAFGLDFNRRNPKGDGRKGTGQKMS